VKESEKWFQLTTHVKGGVADLIGEGRKSTSFDGVGTNCLSRPKEKQELPSSASKKKKSASN